MGNPEEAVTQQSAAPELPGSSPQTHSPDTVPLSADSVWARIKRHKIVEWVLAYIAFGYAALHGSEMLREALEWPAAVPRLTLFALLLGSPIVVTLAWYHGHRARQYVSRTEISILAAFLVIAGSALWWVSRSWHHSTDAATGSTVAGPESPTPFHPPANSVAVLPFTNLSGNPEEEYFSDGISEELINALSQIDALHVAARTSSFSFKGKDADVGTIARKLGVSVVLEGSIRRSGNTVRVTVQLVNTVNGFHLWSEDYDRELNDILTLQTDIATAVAQQLKVRLLGVEAAKIEAGATHNPRAHDAYLRGRQLGLQAHGEEGYRKALVPLNEALVIDPNYAAAHLMRARLLIDIALSTRDLTARTESRELAREEVRRATALAPNLAAAQSMRCFVSAVGFHEFAAAAPYAARSLELAPGDADIQEIWGIYNQILDHHDVAVAALQRAVTLDPLNYRDRENLALGYYYAHRFHEALRMFQDVRALNPKSIRIESAVSYIAIGQPDRARRACEASPSPYESDMRHWCLALAYQALANPKGAEHELAEMMALDGDARALAYAGVHAQWGNTKTALQWLATAEHLEDHDLPWVRADWTLDPIRGEPQFAALVRRLNFPP